MTAKSVVFRDEVSLVPYLGGLGTFVDAIRGRFPHDWDRRRIVLTCAGSGALFFGLDWPCGGIVNDLDDELMSVYFAVRDEPELIMSYVDEALVAPWTFRRWKPELPAAVAARSYLRLLLRYYRYEGRRASLAYFARHRDLVYDPAWIRACSKRLRAPRVEVRCQDMFDLIPEIDREDVLFLINAPGYASLGLHYRHSLSLDDWRRLVKMLAGARGKVLLVNRWYPSSQRLGQRELLEGAGLRCEIVDVDRNCYGLGNQELLFASNCEG